MCFSAGASFAASGALAVAGAATWMRAVKKQKLLAAIPFVFALQQFLEGLQWLAEKPSFESQLLGYAYLAAAFLFWPVYIPFTILSLEKSKERRKALKILVAAGAAVSLYLLFVLLLFPLEVTTACNHVNYNIEAPIREFGGLLYVAVVALAPLFSTNKLLRRFGVATLATAVAAFLFYRVSFTSVWCFFAAVVSGFLYFIVKGNETFMHRIRRRFRR